MAAGFDNKMDTRDNRTADVFGRSDDEVEETVMMTPRELLARLHTSWMNERISPELLPPLTEEVECMLELMRRMNKNLEKLDKNDIRLGVHKMEVERIRFLISNYLRIRLAKIQEFCWSLREQENKRNSQTTSRLSPEEKKFMKDYIEAVESHLKSMGTQHMPRTMQDLQDSKMSMSVTPHLDTFVFLRVNQDSRIVVDDAEGREEEVKLDAKSQHIIRYRPVAQLVPTGAVDLV